MSRAELNPNISRITNQYRILAGSFRTMFDTLSPRTGIRNNFWRSDGDFKNVGDCRYVDNSFVEASFKGPAREHLVFLGRQRNQQTPGENTLTDCMYHREEGGCVLNDLMNPLCLEDIVYANELQERFNIYGYRLSLWIRETLEYVMSGEADEVFVRERSNQVQHLIDYIATFPVLSPQEQKENKLGL